MRENARSKGIWSKQQSKRRRKLLDQACDEVLSEEGLGRLCVLSGKREQWVRLQFPRAVQESRRYRDLMTSHFLSSLISSPNSL